MKRKMNFRDKLMTPFVIIIMNIKLVVVELKKSNQSVTCCKLIKHASMAYIEGQMHHII
jgi:hypothetical protein